MRLFYLSLFILASEFSHAQWKSSVGINIPPIIAKTAEISSEFSKHSGYSLNLNIGYTFNTGYTGFVDYHVYDGVSQRSTSGTFVKAGARLYPTSISGNQKRNRFFIGAHFILSQYQQTALQRDLSENLLFLDTYTPISIKGTTLFPAGTIGFQHNLSKYLILDWGVQKSFVIRDNNYLGRRNRNYQPGAGSAQSDPLIGYLQGILTLKYKFPN